MKFRIIPTNREFYDDFTLAARNLAEGVRRLGDVFADPTESEQRHEAVKQAERAGDEYTQRILTRLDTAFVTPFDPEDIQRLAEAIDDIVDDVYHVSEMVVLTGITEMIPEVVEQVEVLDAMAAKVVELFDHLEGMRGIKPIVAGLDALETQGNRIYRRTVARLFSGDLDPLDVIRWKDITSSMEEALDRVEDMANIVTTIVVKQA